MDRHERNLTTFQQLTDKLKTEMHELPQEKTEKLFRRRAQFNKINFQYLILLEYLCEKLPVEQWEHYNERLGTSVLDYIIERTPHLELIFSNDVFKNQ